MSKKISPIIFWIDRLHWLWLMLAAPLMLFPNPRRSLAMLVVPAVWLLHWYVLRRQRVTSPEAEPAIKNQQNQQSKFSILHYPFPLTPLNGALLLLMIMVLVSTWATYDLSFSLPKISGVVLGLGVFFAMIREGSRLKGWWLGVVLYMSMGLGVALLALLGTDWFASKLSSLFDAVISRLPKLITGLPGAESGFHPNEVAGALTWVLPLLLSLSVSILLWISIGSLKAWQVWSIRFLVWLSTLFVAMVFLLTQSRSGYIGLALASLVMLFLALPKIWRWVMLGMLLLGVIVLALTLSSEDLVQLREWVVGSGLIAESGLSLNSLEGRQEVWSRAIYGLQDFPFTGMGMNTFREVVHVLYPLFLIAPDNDFGHAHNEFLQAGLDLGIPGMIAFIGLYVGTFWMLFRLWKGVTGLRYQVPGEFISPGLLRAFILGLGGGLFAHLLFGLTDAVSLGAKPGILFWLLLGLITALHEQYSAPVDAAGR